MTATATRVRAQTFYSKLIYALRPRVDRNRTEVACKRIPAQEVP